MKLQYLGDSKDSFKWDYHDYLLSEMGYPKFNIALMMTPDDGDNDGNLHPTLFPARSQIIDFCHDIRLKRYIGSINEAVACIKDLPEKTSALYDVSFHKGATYFTNENRNGYFSDFKNSVNQLVFLDPDNGFEPEKSLNEKHVRYADITQILEQLSDESVVSVFQHHRRKKFPDDFSRIKERIETGYTTAIYWHSLMFVTISKSEDAINRVIKANEKYSDDKPVTVIV